MRETCTLSGATDTFGWGQLVYIAQGSLEGVGVGIKKVILEAISLYPMI